MELNYIEIYKSEDHKEHDELIDTTIVSDLKKLYDVLERRSRNGFEIKTSDYILVCFYNEDFEIMDHIAFETNELEDLLRIINDYKTY